MRTTLNLDDELLAAAKRRARERGSTLTSVVEEALAAYLAPRPREKGRFRLRWKTDAGPMLPGVDITDRKSLYDIMEDRS